MIAMCRIRRNMNALVITACWVAVLRPELVLSFCPPMSTYDAVRSSSTVCHAADGNDNNVADIIPELTADEIALKARTKLLCEERNLPFDKVKNARDFSSANGSPIKPNRAYRMGKVSDATHQDTAMLLESIGINTMVDLRSPTELKEDVTLNNNNVFQDFATMIWKESNGKVTEVKGGYDISSKGGKATEDNNDNDDDTTRAADVDPARKERHFVSLMNELKYVKGTLRKLRKRDIAKAVLQSPGAIVSRRVRHRVKDVFLSEINEGGLPMLNELLLRMGAPGIKYVLDLLADVDRHPVALYCTAGKDRTGMVTALVLSVVGVPDEDIVEDYSLSANVYAEIGDHTAMVGALSQRNLDAKTFLGAPPQVMRDTLQNIKTNYGSVNGYLDWIGFGEDDRAKLKRALL